MVRNYEQARNLMRDNMAGWSRLLFGDPSTISGTRIRYGTKGALSICYAGKMRGAWYDHSTGEGGGPLDLIMYARRCDIDSAAAWVLGKSYENIAVPSWVGHRPVREKSHDEKIQLAREVWQNARPIPNDDSPSLRYLERRHIDNVLMHPSTPNWCRQTAAGNLLWPIYDIGKLVHLELSDNLATGAIIGVQRVWLDGSGGKDPAVRIPKETVGLVSGGFGLLPYFSHKSNEPWAATRVFLCEGPETAATINYLTNAATLCSFGSFSQSRIMMAWEATKLYLGLEPGEHFSLVVVEDAGDRSLSRAEHLVPPRSDDLPSAYVLPFPEGHAKNTDWNDLLQRTPDTEMLRQKFERHVHTASIRLPNYMFMDQPR